MMTGTAKGRPRHALLLVLLATLVMWLGWLVPRARSEAGRPSSGTLDLPLPALAPPDVSDSPGAEPWRLAGVPLHIAPGEPQLPVLTLRVLLPPDVIHTSVRVAIADATWFALDGLYDVPPGPPLMASDLGNTVSWGGHAPDAFLDGRLQAIYARDAYWPSDPVLIVTSGSLRNWQVLTVAYWPMAYNPVQGTLRQLVGGVLRVSYERSGQALYPVDAADEALWPVLSRELLNAGDRLLYPVARDPRLPGTDAAVASSQPGYVIITTSAIAANSQQLAAFVAAKQMAGYHVRVITEGASHSSTTYAGGASANQRADNIRRWLADRYLGEGIRYVLLVGDPHPTSFDASRSVPMKLTHPNESVPTDVFYSDLNSNWDLNGNGRFGEFSDLGPGGIDRLPEVFVGRIPFYGSYQELDSILAKLVAYGSATGDLSWRQRALIAAAISNHGPQDNNNDGVPDIPPEHRTFGDDWGQALRQVAVRAGMQAFTLYERQGVYADGSAFPLTSANGALNTGNLLSAWQQGYGIVAWWTHGSQISSHRRVWAHDNTRQDRITQHSQETESPVLFSTTEVPQLNNARPAFVLQASCLNGYPEASNNLGYRLLLNGAVGTVSASRLSYYIPGAWPLGGSTGSGDNASMAYTVMDRMLHQGETVGQALAYYRAFANLHGRPELWQNMLTLNLYGDPSLSVTTSGLVCAAPSQTTPVAPAQGASVMGGQRVELRWQPAERATAYQVQVATDASFGALLDSRETTELGVTVTAAIRGGTHYWRVRGIVDLFGCRVEGTWSEVNSFDAEPLPLPYQVYLPISVRR